MINCFPTLFHIIYFRGTQLKHMTSYKVNPRKLIPSIKQGFKAVLKRPALRNLILVIFACIHTKTFKINTLANNLPICVAHNKTKQKRLLRFINSNFPTSTAMGAWCAYVLRQLYDKTGCAPRFMLVDETDILQNYRIIVIAVPFRKRAIPIYWEIYEKDAFDKMVYPSHNVLVQEFCCQFIQQFETTLPNVRKPIFVFDRGFARARYLIKPLMKSGIKFVIRVCKNASFYDKGQRIKLETLKNTVSYPNISYHSTEKLKLNLLVFRDEDHKEPLYLVSNSLQNSQLYLAYKRRMQIEECFRDIKTLFGFRHLRLKRQELPRIALLWFIVCVSYGICFLHFEKSGERWIKTYNTYHQKTYSLIFVIKRILEITWEPGIFLDPYFTITDCTG